MGLDIYFRLTKSKSNNIDEITKEDDVIAQNELARKIDKFKKHLKASYESNDGTYCFWYRKLEKMLNKELRYEFKTEPMRRKFMDFNELSLFLDGVVKHHYAMNDAYFRKVNFIYRFFEHKLDNECCFCTLDELKDLVDRCDRVLHDCYLAQELLPTRDGFFFGNTEYDVWYFNDLRDCKRLISPLINKMEKNPKYRCFVIMSW